MLLDMTTQNHKATLGERFHAFAQQRSDLSPPIVTTTTLKEAGFHPQEIARLVQQGELEQAQRGVYALSTLGGVAFSHLGRVFEVAQRFPKAVLCLVSAASYHRLVTTEPLNVELALHRERTGHRPKALGVDFYWMTDQIFQYGQQTDQTYGAPVCVYSPAKTVADLCRRRHKVGMNLYLEALKSYLRHGGPDGEGGPVAPLLEAARVCDVEGPLRHDLLVLHG